jgi:DtxR family Mn-dependent transcriptional regulator
MPKDDPASSVSDAAGDYLKAIWRLSRDGPATTNAVAAALGFTPASVSGMLARLADAGLVEHVRYRGATLTDAGLREALRLVRRHRLVETFMIRRLGYKWDEVHEEAEALEHAVSDRFAERLAALLDHPTHDPHGDPIPGADGTLPTTPDLPLVEIDDGERLRVARLLSQDAAVLGHLAELGIEPGALVRVIDREPHGGMLRVEVAERPCALSRDLAERVRGERIAAERDGAPRRDGAGAE